MTACGFNELSSRIPDGWNAAAYQNNQNLLLFIKIKLFKWS